MPFATIHFHTKEGENLRLGKSSRDIAKDFEKSRIDYLVLTDKVSIGERARLPVKAFKRIKSYLSKKKENLLFGLEFIGQGYHLLGICMEVEKWEKEKCPSSLEEICYKIEESNGVIGIPHPFGPCGIGRKGIEYICALQEKGYLKYKPLIEVSFYLESFPSRHRGLRRENKKAIEIARSKNLALYAGLDSRFSRIDLAYNEFSSDLAKDLKEASLKGFKNSNIIPYISPVHFPMWRETAYLVRDNLMHFLRNGNSALLNFALNSLKRFTF